VRVVLRRGECATRRRPPRAAPPLPTSPLGIAPHVHTWRHVCAARLAEDDIAGLVGERRERAHGICDLELSENLQSLAILKVRNEAPGSSEAVTSAALRGG
jgi:hypothetical protein